MAQMIIITLSIRIGGIIMRKRDVYLSRGNIGSSGNTVVSCETDMKDTR